jgi:cysteinyl-tRNA synthetase
VTSSRERNKRGGQLTASSIRVFNTLTSRKEELVPLRPGEVGIYVCGPTVYSHVHIGNARTFTAFDVIVRYLRYRGFKVTYVRNFTDIDDKIIDAARQSGEDAISFAARFVEEFRRDAKALRLSEPDISPKVSDHLPEIVALIRTLIDRGVAYESQGDVYFSVASDPEYAKLSRRNLDELKAGQRVQPGEQKRDPLDFALWKAAKPGEPAWESPWGAGRPGWHIECSAMAAKYLGETFDIHGGGMDLIFPHHENEIAQSEAAFQKPFSRYWLHGGFLDLEGAKMSKSLGNVVRLRDALARVDPEALRLFFLSTHYRHALDFSDKALSDAEARMEYFYETLQKVDERIAGMEFGPGPMYGNPRAYLNEFESAMNDDFNSAGATAALSGLFAAMNALVDKPTTKDKAIVGRTLGALRAVVPKISSVMGLFERTPAEWLLERRGRAVKEKGIDTAKVEALIEERSRARARKDFQEADRLRDELKALGVELTDKPVQTTWKVAT